MQELVFDQLVDDGNVFARNLSSRVADLPSNYHLMFWVGTEMFSIFRYLIRQFCPARMMLGIPIATFSYVLLPYIRQPPYRHLTHTGSPPPPLSPTQCYEFHCVVEESHRACKYSIYQLKISINLIYRTILGINCNSREHQFIAFIFRNFVEEMLLSTSR